MSHEPSSQSITRKDMQCLLPHQWLNDEVGQQRARDHFCCGQRFSCFPQAQELLLDTPSKEPQRANQSVAAKAEWSVT